jgi:hypothetical protein
MKMFGSNALRSIEGGLSFCQVRDDGYEYSESLLVCISEGVGVKGNIILLCSNISNGKSFQAIHPQLIEN